MCLGRKARSRRRPADLVVISDEPSVVVVEAKKRASGSFKANVAGQVLLYLVTGLTATVDETIDGLQKSARRKRNGKSTLRALLADADAKEGELRTWIERARASTLAGSEGFRAVIATDHWDDKKDQRRIGKIVRFLRERGISIDILEVRDGAVTSVLQGKAAVA